MTVIIRAFDFSKTRGKVEFDADPIFGRKDAYITQEAQAA